MRFTIRPRIESAVVLLVIALVVLIVRMVAADGTVEVAGVLGPVATGASAAAVILLALGAWLGGGRAVALVAVAVAVFSVSFAAPPTVPGVGTAAHAAVLVAVGLLVGAAVAGRPGPVVTTLLRRTTIAFGVVLAGRVGALLTSGTDGSIVTTAGDLAGVVLVLVSSVPYVSATASALWNQHEEWQARLAVAEATADEVARRDHEIRNVVLGLAGAAGAIGARIESPTGKRLHAVASAELDRLRVLLDDRDDTGPAPGYAPVGDVLADLVAVHRAGGARLTLRTQHSLYAAVDRRALAQVVTNLLVNCARHAPGAPVEVRARRTGDLVRIEVVDAGPGLPLGVDPAALLAPGVRASTSPGDGLGLAITSDVVRRCGGRMWLERSRPHPGCTAVVELRAAALPRPVQRRAAERVG